ncbi:MAG: aldo/keto reductase [Candidatus Brocadiia bacterium]
MEYVALGGTGERVSRLGCGGAPAGLTNYLEEYDPQVARQREQVLAALECAIELGVTYFDTAPGYGQGAGEAIFGEALEPHGDGVFIASKYGLWQGQQLRESVEGSLRRLRCDRLDLLQIHGGSYSEQQVDEILAPGGLLERMEGLREEGMVRYLGFTSEDNNPGLYRLMRCGRFDVVQLCYNFLHQHPYDPSREHGSLYVARECGLGTAAMRVTTSGLFSRWLAQVNPDGAFGYTPALIQFVLSCPLVDVALVGMRRPEEVEQNVSLVEDRAGRVDLDRLFERYV